MSADKLAIDGGPKTITTRFPPRSYQLKRAAMLTADVLKMIPWIARGKTTITDGSGVIEKFENAFCELTGSAFALGMNNGTATLHSAYFAVGAGPGTEVIVPSYTWHASATPILQCGATPVFCDIDPRTLNIDPEDLERRITDRTKAVCVVHVWGNPAEMDRIMQIADRDGIAVVEDCSHAHGAAYKGKSVGKWGAIGCFSLNSSKAIDGGEAGVAVTDDPVLFDNMLLLGHFGRLQSGQAAKTFDIGDMSVGSKYRPHACGIHLAMASLKRIHDLNDRCQRVWDFLCEELEGVDGIRPIETLPGAVRGGFYSFVLAYEAAEQGGPSRDDFVSAVQAEGIPLSADRYSQMNFTYGMLHQAPLFTSFDRRRIGGGCYDATRPWAENISTVRLPVCERVGQQLVSLPPVFNIADESFARSCGRAIKKVLAGLPWPAKRPAAKTSPPAKDDQRPIPSEAAV